jgi:hypothetical protein
MIGILNSPLAKGAGGLKLKLIESISLTLFSKREFAS